jgi:hypothetical protein
MIPHFQLPGIVRPSHRRRHSRVASIIAIWRRLFASRARTHTRTREELDEIRAKHAADCREALAREFGR